MFSETEINEECTFIEHSMRYVFVAKSFRDLVILLALWIVHPSSPLKPLIKNFYQSLFYAEHAIQCKVKPFPVEPTIDHDY